MAQFKSRNNRRSSSTSYASTLTILIFIALCVLGIWMLTPNTVVPPKTQRQSDENTTTRTAIDTSETTNDFSSSEDPSETTTRPTEDLPETTTTITTTTNKPTEDSAETTTTIATTNGATTGIEESAETTAKSSEDSAETTTIPTTTTAKSSEDSAETTATTTSSEESAETTTKSQDQKDNPVFGDNPGHLPDEAIAHTNTIEPQKQHIAGNTASKVSEESLLSQKQKASVINETGSDNDQNKPELVKVQQSSNTEKNRESHNVINAGGHQEQNTGGVRHDVQSFNPQGSKNDEDEINKQQLREDKGEIIEKDNQPQQESNADVKGESAKLSQAESEPKENQKAQGESKETQKPKKEKNKHKPSKSLRKEKKSKQSWSTQVDESKDEKEKQKDEPGSSKEEVQDLTWHLCNVTAGADYIPCLDNEKYLKTSSRKHFDHRERHCPEDAPTCLVPLPTGYKTPIEWPNSRDKIWYHNVPHTKLAEVKGHQNWVKVTGEFLTFPGGGTQFIHGALHYVDFLQEAEADIAWGKHTRVILDVGCGVGSFGGYLFERDVIAMSFAPKDEHEAQVQFALERGIPAISAVMGSKRLQFPGHVFDLVHCARCRVPWHADGGMLLLELNRLLRPGGYFVWSATPVYQTDEEDVEIWKQMSSLTKSMCWELVTIKRDALNQIGAVFYRKPTSNECYEKREQNEPPMCKDDDDPSAAWYVPLQACIHRLPIDKAERGTRWPEPWPSRLHKVPYWLNNSQTGVYGKPTAQDFVADDERWKNVVDEISNIGITWSNVRNVMDMRAVYGGFAAALRDLPVWVFNVVNVDAADTLPIIYERGLVGMYHDWCESFSTYPRTYDLLHADNLFSKLKPRCKLVPVIVEVDRIVRPGGKLIVRDESSAIGEVENLLKSLHWEITLSKNQEGLLCANKGYWRPDHSVALS